MAQFRQKESKAWQYHDTFMTIQYLFQISINYETDAKRFIKFTLRTAKLLELYSCCLMTPILYIRFCCYTKNSICLSDNYHTKPLRQQIKHFSCYRFNYARKFLRNHVTTVFLTEYCWTQTLFCPIYLQK